MATDFPNDRCRWSQQQSFGGMGALLVCDERSMGTMVTRLWQERIDREKRGKKSAPNSVAARRTTPHQIVGYRGMMRARRRRRHRTPTMATVRERDSEPTGFERSVRPPRLRRSDGSLRWSMTITSRSRVLLLPELLKLIRFLRGDGSEKRRKRIEGTLCSSLGRLLQQRRYSSTCNPGRARPSRHRLRRQPQRATPSRRSRKQGRLV